MQYPKTLRAVGEWTAGRPRAHWPNAYVDARDFLIQYGEKDGNVVRRRTIDPMNADAIIGGKGLNRTWGFSPPLAFFAVDLLYFLGVTPSITYSVGGGLNAAGTGDDGYFYRTLLPQQELLRLPFGPEPESPPATGPT